MFKHLRMILACQKLLGQLWENLFKSQFSFLQCKLLALFFLHVSQVFCMLPKLHRSEKTGVSCTTCRHPSPLHCNTLHCIALQCSSLYCIAIYPFPNVIVLCVELLNILICSPPKLGHALFWVH